MAPTLFHSSNFEPARALMLVVTLIVALVCMPLSLLLYILGLIVAWSHPRRRFTQPHSCTDAFLGETSLIENHIILQHML